ncbi:hypothetical protein [Streptomyces sp. PA5.6]|uniref:hypothetical protein n=1 Tax=Streptomyces sp. PA5.6 TaxID=3035651 RepID=UPI003904CAEC
MTSHPTGLPTADDAPYFLFAHEPYFPLNGLLEINTTVVEAATLLHSQVQQPDGARMHRLLNNGCRAPREIVPLATLTHELEGGVKWPLIADWERVIQDLVFLSRFGICYSMPLALPAIERALICSGPYVDVLAFDAATGQPVTYGAADRTSLLSRLQAHLAPPAGRTRTRPRTKRRLPPRQAPALMYRPRSCAQVCPTQQESSVTHHGMPPAPCIALSVLALALTVTAGSRFLNTAALWNWKEAYKDREDYDDQCVGGQYFPATAADETTYALETTDGGALVSYTLHIADIFLWSAR